MGREVFLSLKVKFESWEEEREKNGIAQRGAWKSAEFAEGLSPRCVWVGGVDSANRELAPRTPKLVPRAEAQILKDAGAGLGFDAERRTAMQRGFVEEEGLSAFRVSPSARCWACEGEAELDGKNRGYGSRSFL